MLTWLMIGIAAQVAWMIMSFGILKLVTFKDVLEMDVIGWLAMILFIVINIIVWPAAVAINIVVLYEISKVESQE